MSLQFADSTKYLIPFFLVDQTNGQNPTETKPYRMSRGSNNRAVHAALARLIGNMTDTLSWVTASNAPVAKCLNRSKRTPTKTAGRECTSA